MPSVTSHFREQIDGPHATVADALVANDPNAHHGMAHVVPPSILIGVFAALMILTGITVGVTYWDFGYQTNLIVALVIAVVKAVLVIAYFMHLRYDNLLYTVLVGLCLAFIAVFIGFTILDTHQYSPNLTPVPVTAAP
jgi:cytochrome c oxidase subunit 4